ncbi:MAG: phosphate/phosphite/phosphonate ABC transporter substrate-binding protein [Epsilonproteobacteria bacterium]|nr:MAG: phosphate/phosphite/phosphonate ABC transporter substrate-binding protein [Campylobacterota bacterium]
MRWSLAICIIIFSLTGCLKEQQLGSIDNPIKLFFTPSISSGIITENSKVFLQYLEQETGLYFITKIPTSYIAVVEAFGSKRADIGIMNSFGYLLAHEKYGATAELKIIRYGRDFYRGQIVAHVDSGIKAIKDIQGKRFAFTDSSSASGYMFPLKILMENKVKPGNTVFAIKHDNVISMIYQGQVKAGSTFHSAPSADGTINDARRLVLTQFPDVMDKIKIIAITDKIPNDPFVFREDLSNEIKKKFKHALFKFLKTKKGQDIFFNIYNFKGVVPAIDSDYDNLRNVIKTIKLDLDGLIK